MPTLREKYIKLDRELADRKAQLIREIQPIISKFMVETEIPIKSIEVHVLQSFIKPTLNYISIIT